MLDEKQVDALDKSMEEFQERVNGDKELQNELKLARNIISNEESFV